MIVGLLNDMGRFFVDRERIVYSSGGKEASLYKADAPDMPLVIFNNYSGDGSTVVAALAEMNCPDCNLLSVGGLDWNHDMTPWYCPPLYPEDTPCTGGADEYLKLLLEEIIPNTKEKLSGSPAFIGIAGYSLAGLFALYAIYQTDCFDRVASMSGSLWFPDFKEYALQNKMKKEPERIYLSLGDKEARTKNQYLKTVQQNTEAIAEHYKELGLNVTCELSPGNHFKDADIRSAKGIAALLCH